MIRWITGALMGIALAQTATASIKDYPFRVDTRAAGKEHFLVAVNNGPAPITLSAQIKGSNVASDRNWPLVEVIPPHSSRKIARVFASKVGEGYKFNTRYSHGFGNVLLATDPSVLYRIPLANGVKSIVGQAPGGEITTHKGADSRYAIDFTVPENTPIVAAHSGTVIDVEDSFTKGGEETNLLDKGNVITIIHEDGSMASYVHLAAHSAKVKTGDRVIEGQLIAYSGNTGYSSGPHLHFAVSKAVIRKDGVVATESMPVTFYAFKPPLRFAAEQNMALVADYEHAGDSIVTKTTEIPRAAIQAPPVVEEAGRPDPDSLTLEGQHDAQYWLDEIDRRTGYPWWAWIGAMFCGFALLALLAELFGTFAEKKEQLEA